MGATTNKYLDKAGVQRLLHNLEKHESIDTTSSNLFSYDIPNWCGRFVLTLTSDNIQRIYDASGFSIYVGFNTLNYYNKILDYSTSQSYSNPPHIMLRIEGTKEAINGMWICSGVFKSGNNDPIPLIGKSPANSNSLQVSLSLVGNTEQQGSGTPSTSAEAEWDIALLYA